MEPVTSNDGTTIAFDRIGEGPPVVLVSGGSTDRTANAPLAALLAATSPRVRLESSCPFIWRVRSRGCTVGSSGRVQSEKG
jgi:hypothetical protein